MNGGLAQYFGNQLSSITKSLLMILLTVGVAAGTGFFIPMPEKWLRPHVTVLSALFAILSWSSFHLIVPARYSRRLIFRRLQFVLVPLIWVLLVVITSALFWQLLTFEKQRMEELDPQYCLCSPHSPAITAMNRLELAALEFSS